MPKIARSEIRPTYTDVGSAQDRQERDSADLQGSVGVPTPTIPFKNLEDNSLMPEETIFSKIIRGEAQADVVYRDDRVTAFRDISPQAPTHVLIVPNKPLPTVNDVTEGDEADLGHLFVVAAKLAQEEGIAESGYRLIVNCNRDGGQVVFHLHMHLLGGRPLGRMVAKL